MRSVPKKRVGKAGKKSETAAEVYSSYNRLPISKFLTKCDIYHNDSKKWINIWSPSTRLPVLKSDQVLYHPLCDIIRAIFTFFDKKKPGMRWIETTRNKAMIHDKDGFSYSRNHDGGSTAPGVGKNSPDLCIMGRGMNFCPTDHMPKEAQYTHCLAPIDVKTENTLARDSEKVLIQLSLYARQCFFQQPHRRYVPTVVLTERHVYLHVYDRSGALLPEKVINYHTDPKTFVRIILGISSITGELESSAFDPRVMWKEEGTLSPIVMIPKPWDDVLTRKLRSSRKSRDTYQTEGQPFVRSKVWGRGTVCWTARCVVPGADNESRPVIIKDSWRRAEAQNEWELLKEVKGLAGVCQMITYEDDTEHPISKLRNHVVKGLYEKDTQKYDGDRIFCRLVLEKYGKSIKHFESKLQLLQALHDAVAGHKNLWLKGILHQDISVENILLGRKDADVGNRGVLIDLDMSIKVNDTTNPSDDQQIMVVGTLAFQSIAILEWSTRAPNASPHTHHDDLESFFYVLAWICLEFNGPENSVDCQYLTKWEIDDDDEACATAKTSFLDIPWMHLQPYFKYDNIFRTLFVSLANLCKERLDEKREIVRRKELFPSLATVYSSPTSCSGEDHDKFLNIIKIAIDALESQATGSRSAPINIFPSISSINENTDRLEESALSRSKDCKGKRKTEESSEDESVRTELVESQEIPTKNWKPTKKMKFMESQEI